jgi:hypothetical protein
MGVEPTPRAATVRGNGFEDRESHRAPCASARSLASGPDRACRTSGGGVVNHLDVAAALHHRARHAVNDVRLAHYGIPAHGAALGGRVERHVAVLANFALDRGMPSEVGTPVDAK